MGSLLVVREICIPVCGDGLLLNPTALSTMHECYRIQLVLLANEITVIGIEMSV